MQISLDQARAFCAVVDFEGYSKASEHLHKSHSALVYLVKTLEEQCGLKLFDRTGYRNSLTGAGRKVYLKCQELLVKVDELQHICGQLNQGWEASLKIVFDGILPFDPFLKLYKKFKSEKIPTVVQTYADYLEDVEASFHKLNADLMISILPVDKKGLEGIALQSFTHHLVAHKDHPLHHSHRRWSAEELKKFDFLSIRGSGRRLGLNTREFEETASFFLSDFSFKKEAILKKTGFGWLPEHLIQSELRNKTLLPLRWERSSEQIIQPMLYLHKQKTRGLATDLILNFLKA